MLERISSNLFQPVSADEAAMVLGGQETVHTFVGNGDGSYTYIGKDAFIEPTAQAVAE